MTTVATTSWPTLTSSTPPHCMNTKLVDVAGHPGDQAIRAAPPSGEDGEVVDVPERAHPQPGERGLRRPEQPDVHAEHGGGGDQHDERTGEHQPGDQRQVGPAGRQARGR